MIPSSSLYSLSHPDFVNTDSKALYPNRCLTPPGTHHLGLFFPQNILDLVFTVDHTYQDMVKHTQLQIIFLGGKKAMKK